MVGVPYTDRNDRGREGGLGKAQADPDADTEGLLAKRYPKANVSNFDTQPGITEMDALVAYLQMLGTMVDFSTFEPDPNRVRGTGMDLYSKTCGSLPTAGRLLALCCRLCRLCSHLGLPARGQGPAFRHRANPLSRMKTDLPGPRRRQNEQATG